MDEAVGTEKGERTPNRQGYRSGYNGRHRGGRSYGCAFELPSDNLVSIDLDFSVHGRWTDPATE